MEKELKIEIETYDSLPCATNLFKINDIEADKDWFVNGYDHDSYSDEECSENDDLNYACCNWYADHLKLDEVRKNLPEEFKFLNDEQICKIQNELCDKLNVGSCGWCV